MTDASGPAYRWYAAAGVVVLATAAAGAVLYPDLPQSLPVHWNGAMNAPAGPGLVAGVALPLLAR